MWRHMLKGMEKLAAEFSERPGAGRCQKRDRWNRPGPTGRKRPSPLWAKIVKVLRSVYRAYCDLKSQI